MLMIKWSGRRRRPARAPSRTPVGPSRQPSLGVVRVHATAGLGSDDIARPIRAIYSAHPNIDVRVGSVTTANTIHKLRRAAQLLDPNRDFTWVAELEKDFAVSVPRGADGQPAHEAQVLVVGHLQPELADVKVEGFVLIQDPHM